MFLRTCTGLCILACLSMPLQAAERLTIDDAVRKALRTHASINAADGLIAIEEARRQQAFSPPRPHIFITWDDNAVASGIGVNNRKIGVEQTFEFPTNYVLRGAAGSGAIQRAEAESRVARLALETNVRAAYAQTLAAEALAELADSAVAIAQQFADGSARRREVGSAGALEFAQASIELGLARRSRLGARREYQRSTAELRMLTGIEPSEEIILLDSLRASPEVDSLPDMQRRARQSHPQLLATHAASENAHTSVVAATHAVIPELSLQYAAQTIAGVSSFFSAGVSVSVPLWFWGEQRGRINEAEAVAAIRDAEAAQTARDVSSRLAAAYDECRAAGEEASLYGTQLLPHATDAYRTAVRSYQLGEATWVEVLLTQRSLNEIRTGYIHALCELALRHIALDAAAGISRTK